ncbi:MAG: hypothetical protein WC827_00560 [Candidatus Paceibacterota bacterium]|jgi:hypothetical protein
MSFSGKHFSKSDRKKSPNRCRCGKPLSGSRIKKGKIECFDCEEGMRRRLHGVSLSSSGRW